MKKWITGLLTVVLLFFIAGLGFSLTSCESISKNSSVEKKDSAFVIGLVDKYFHPEMTSVDEAVTLQNQEVADADYDKVFQEMPQSTLHTIVSVLLKRSHGNPFTVKDVSMEYLSNKKVYDNLPDCNKEEKVQQIDGQSVELDSTMEDVE